MSAQSEGNTAETSKEWDPGTLKGLLAGLWQTTLAGVLIVITLLLVLVAGALPSFSDDLSMVSYLGGVCGIVYATGFLVRYHRGTRSGWWTDTRLNIASRTGLAVTFVALFAFVPATGMLAAFGYLAGRLLTLIYLYAAN